METINHTTTIPKVKRKEPLCLESGYSHQIKIERPSFWLLEIEDAVFRTDSTAFMPDVLEEDKKPDKPKQCIAGLQSVVNLFKFITLRMHQNKRMLITGHADTTGDAPYNHKLSRFRSNTILSIITNDRLSWCSQFKERRKDGVQIYRDEDIQHYLVWIARTKKWNCHPGKVDGVIGEKSRAAIKQFQVEYNVNYEKAIKEDGVAGEETWGAFFDVLQEELSTRVNKWLSNQSSGQNIEGLRSVIKWYNVNERGSGSICGCGETWPIEEALRDNYVSQVNRRGEILFFHPEDMADLPCTGAKGKCVEKKCPIYGKGSDGKPFYIRNYTIWDDNVDNNFFFSS